MVVLKSRYRSDFGIKPDLIMALTLDPPALNNKFYKNSVTL